MIPLRERERERQREGGREKVRKNVSDRESRKSRSVPPM